MMLASEDYRLRADVAELLQRLGGAGDRPHDPVLSLYASVVESMDGDGVVPAEVCRELGGQAPWLALEEAGVVRRYRGGPADALQVVHFYLFTEPVTQPSSRVYFIASGESGPIKIGRSRRPAHRVADLQTGSPERLRVLAHLPGDSVLESILKDAFRPWRIHGEWFRRNDRLLRLIEEVRAP